MHLVSKVMPAMLRPVGRFTQFDTEDTPEDGGEDARTPLPEGVEHAHRERSTDTERTERSELSLTDIIGVGTGRRGDRSGLAGIQAALAATSATSARSVSRESSSTGDGDDEEDEVNQLTQSQPFTHLQPFSQGQTLGQSGAVETLTGASSSNKAHSRLSDSALPSGLGEQAQGQLSEDGDVLGAGGSASSKPPLPPASRHAYTLPAQARQTGLVAPDTHNQTNSSGDSTSSATKSPKGNEKSLKGGKVEKPGKAEKSEKEGKTEKAEKGEKHHGNRVLGGLKAIFRSGRNGHGKARSKFSLGGSDSQNGAETSSMNEITSRYDLGKVGIIPNKLPCSFIIVLHSFINKHRILFTKIDFKLHRSNNINALFYSKFYFSQIFVF